MYSTRTSMVTNDVELLLASFNSIFLSSPFRKAAIHYADKP